MNDDHPVIAVGVFLFLRYPEIGGIGYKDLWYFPIFEMKSGNR